MEITEKVKIVNRLGFHFESGGDVCEEPPPNLNAGFW